MCSRRAGDLLFLQQRKKSKQKNAALYSLVLIKKLMRIPENCTDNINLYFNLLVHCSIAGSSR